MTASAETPETLGYRHVRTIAGLVGMGLAIGAAVAIQVVRHAEQAALVAKGVALPEVVLPTTWLQFTYSLAIPVGMPLVLFVSSLMLFSPSVLGELRRLLPGWRTPSP